MSPELIAINELFFDDPVAKALGPADWKIPISGTLIFSLFDCLSTTCRYHFSKSFEENFFNEALILIFDILIFFQALLGLIELRWIIHNIDKETIDRFPLFLN